MVKEKNLLEIWPELQKPVDWGNINRQSSAWFIGHHGGIENEIKVMLLPRREALKIVTRGAGIWPHDKYVQAWFAEMKRLLG